MLELLDIVRRHSNAMRGYTTTPKSSRSAPVDCVGGGYLRKCLLLLLAG